MPDGTTRRGSEYPFSRELFAIRERDVLAASAFARYSHCVTMIAEGKDGDRAEAVARTLGMEVVRGSSRHHSIAAALGFARALRESPLPSVLVVDGPVGPMGVAKEGIVSMAAHSGRDIVPAALDASPKITLRYLWSQMIVPLPFARVRAVLANPLPAQDAKSQSRENVAREVTAIIASCALEARRRL